MSEPEPPPDPEAPDPDPGPADADPADAGPADAPVFSGYGLASAALALLAVTAVVLGGLIWSGHRREQAERAYETAVLQTAADWVGQLANIDTDNVEQTMQTLHEATVGPLNAEFESAMAPYRTVVRRLQARSSGRIEAVALESLRHDEAGGRARPPAEQRAPELAGRTDTALVVATSVADNVGGDPQTVRWTLRVEVSDVDGTPKISGLEFLR
ncbi:MAG TPA: hypothetical protein VK069_06670 [Mycolicibacillus parakoreensis]|nr:hypothetical protein [Mycolicibacillus parakoreensis]